jgi:hypothetical protein
MLEALEGRLAVDEFAHRPDESLKNSSRRSISEADQAKTVMVPTPSFWLT